MYPFAVLDNAFLVQFEPFKTDHRHLVDLTNRAYTCFLNRKYECLALLLDELADFATYHFAAEERELARLKLPAADQHIASHHLFFQRITEYGKRISSGDTLLYIEVLLFLKTWITDHILNWDQESRVGSSPVKAA